MSNIKYKFIKSSKQGLILNSQCLKYSVVWFFSLYTVYEHIRVQGHEAYSRKRAKEREVHKQNFIISDYMKIWKAINQY